MTKEIRISLSKNAFIRETINRKLKIDYTKLLFECMKNPDCLANRDDNETCNNNLINSIIFEGRHQLGREADFEDIIIAGASTIAKLLGLL